MTRENYHDFEVSTLIVKYLTNSLNEKERDSIEKLIEADDRVSSIIEFYQNPDNFEDRLVYINNLDLRIAKEKILRKHNRKKHIKFKQLLPYAAILIVFLSIGLWFAISRNNDQTKVSFAQDNNDAILPGGNKATLTLADGTKIPLDEVSMGAIAQQSNKIIYKNESGQIVYKDNGDKSFLSSSKLNTITTPRGGMYNVVLPDGTKVWLNAASSLTYPTGFDDSERLVELTGEAYFEVTKSSKQFVVKTERATIQVLGTHFNVMAYENESDIETTLLEGTVKVHSITNSTLIKPGQKASISPLNSISTSNLSDPTAAIAWKLGYFQFENANVENLIRQIARWYKVDIEYRGKLTGVSLKGKLPRDASITEVISMLDFVGINCEIIGNKLIINGKTLNESYEIKN